MTNNQEIGSQGQSFCGNCGTRLQPGDTACARCGSPVISGPTPEPASAGPSPAETQGREAPTDYVPYCRSGGETVRWEESHTCSNCGLSPLCSLHFEAGRGLCVGCSESRARAAPESLCRGCGAPLGLGQEVCHNCGVRQPGTGIPQDQGAVEYMGFWVRLGARLVDGIVLMLVAMFLARLGSYGLVALLIIIWTYFVTFTVWRGQTPGKMAFGIQVINSQGRLPTLGQAILREVPGKFISEIFLLLGCAWAGWDPKKRAWHDYIGGTYVVRKRPPSR